MLITLNTVVVLIYHGCYEHIVFVASSRVLDVGGTPMHCSEKLG